MAWFEQLDPGLELRTTGVVVIRHMLVNGASTYIRMTDGRLL